jgi:hypothetical protein
VNDLLNRFGMDNSKPIKTPMATNAHLDLDEGGTTSRSDIMFSVCMCARFQASPKECHMMAVKRILRYLRQTPNLGLWYPKSAQFILIGYSDSDYASYKIDIKSTLGTCQLLVRCLVSWRKLNMFPPVVVVHNYFR